MDLDVVVLEEFDEGVDCAAVAEVAGEGDDESIHGSHFLADGEEVEEGLSWVFFASVSTIDDGDWRELCGDVG